MAALTVTQPASDGMQRGLTGEPAGQPQQRMPAGKPDPHEMATIITPPGSSGRPKGRAPSDHNILDKCPQLSTWAPMRPDHLSLSFLAVIRYV